MIARIKQLLSRPVQVPPEEPAVDAFPVIVVSTDGDMGKLLTAALDALEESEDYPFRTNYMGNEWRWCGDDDEKLNRRQLARALEESALWFDVRGVPTKPPAAVVAEVYRWLYFWGCVR